MTYRKIEPLLPPYDGGWYLLWGGGIRRWDYDKDPLGEHEGVIAKWTGEGWSMRRGSDGEACDREVVNPTHWQAIPTLKDVIEASTAVISLVEKAFELDKK